MMGKVVICDHPLIQHKLTFIRNRETKTKDFRQLLEEISKLMAYEITRDLPVEDIEVHTPVSEAKGKIISGRMLALIPVLRAGLGMVEGVLALHPTAKVGHIGLFRDPDSLQPVEYYVKLPVDIAERQAIIVDPMLATGGSATAAINILKRKACTQITLMCLIAAPEGIRAVQETHPDVDIYAAAVDDYLNDHGYIVPGLGDAGDRLFGTN